MSINRAWNGAPKVTRYLHSHPHISMPWILRWKPVCASTEKELTQWLRDEPEVLSLARAYISGRQNHGVGQYGRVWKSLKGGAWLSAALPVKDFQYSMELFGLAAAFALSERLKENGINVKIKWPNDLIVGDKKIAGFLPKLLFRGDKLRIARIGIGLNIANNVPEEGISLFKISQNFHIEYWIVEILFCLERALKLLEDKSTLCCNIENIFWSRSIIDIETGYEWKIEGLDNRGGLKVTRNDEKKVIRRSNQISFI